MRSMSASARFDGSANVLGLQNQLFYLGPGFRFRIYIDTTWHFIGGGEEKRASTNGQSFL